MSELIDGKLVISDKELEWLEDLNKAEESWLILRLDRRFGGKMDQEEIKETIKPIIYFKEKYPTEYYKHERRK